MKAILLEQAGGVENLILKDIAKPELKDNEVLVENQAISINPADTKVKYSNEGLNMLISPERPIVLGWDIAGTIVAVGDKVSQYQIGDKVFGMVNFPGHGKAYAEYVAAPESHLAAIPKGTSFTQAAATTLAALTALQALKGRVSPGDKVLIHAGSGGVGHFAVQIAKKMGAYVVSTSSSKNLDFVMSLGADEHIDYRTQAFEEAVSDMNLVFDTVSADTAEKSLRVLGKGGRLVSITLMEIPADLQAKADALEVSIDKLLVQSNGEDMKLLSSWLESGAIKPHVSQTFAFEKLGEAHTSIEAGRSVGKVIVTL